ncbi:MAG TPA: alpha/beta hydrolase [Caulobacteraceae bacterium]|jgi:lysophospholipase
MDAQTTVIGQPAPLLSFADAPFPPGTTAIWYEGAGGLPMRAAYAAAENPVGSVVLSPGRTEPIEKYVEVVGELVARGFCVLAHDWRGQGRSSRLLPDRLRGHAQGYEDFIEDFRRLMAAFDARLPHPRIAMGHSMGGCLTLTALAKGVGGFDAAILSAPMLGLNTGSTPAWLARALAGLMTGLGRGGDYVLGSVTDPYSTRFETDRLTHDHARYDRTRAQILADRDLALGNLTWGWLNSAFKAVDWLHRAPEVTRIALPLVVTGAELDTLVNNADQKAVTARVPGARYVEVAGAYHEILMETDAIRAQFWREFDRLVEAIAPRA